MKYVDPSGHKKCGQDSIEYLKNKHSLSDSQAENLFYSIKNSTGYDESKFNSMLKNGELDGKYVLPNYLKTSSGQPIPYGFSSEEQYVHFVDELKKKLPEGTYAASFQGSSVKGKSYKRNVPFDENSDFDIALVNDDILLQALELAKALDMDGLEEKMSEISCN